MMYIKLKQILFFFFGSLSFLFLLLFFINSGLGRNQSHREDLRPNNHHRSTSLCKSHDLHAFPWLSRRARASWRVSLYWLCQHHWLLRDLRFGHGNGTHLWTSLWRKTMETSWLNFAKDNTSSFVNLHSHLFHVAKHEKNPPLVWPRPRNIFGSPYFHSLFHS